jgi:hypothetical protein
VQHAHPKDMFAKAKRYQNLVHHCIFFKSEKDFGKIIFWKKNIFVEHDILYFY